MNTLVADSFASFGVFFRPLILATVLFGLWRGLRRTALPGRTRLATWLAVAVPLLLWFVLILQLAQAGFFVASPGGRVPGIPLAVVVPLVTGLVLLTRSSRVAAAADVTPLHWLVGVQVFRVLGAAFLLQWAAGRLPGVFAIPAGTGDVLVGLLALPAALYLRSGRPGGRAVAYVWNWLGILDLAVALTLGFLSSPTRFQVLALDAPNRVVGTYPLVMIPAFAVPLALILHGLSIWQLRRSARAGERGRPKA
jgi:hypothetical protein